MNKIIIREWYGRLGNNVIQILNAIQTGLLNNYNIVIFPNHNEFKINFIVFDNKIYNNKPNFIDNIHDNFYWYGIRGIIPMNTNIIVNIFDKYIKDILIYNVDKTLNYNNSIHIRSDDTIGNREYIAAPIYFVDKVFTEDLIVVSQDTLQPTTKYLINKGCKWSKNNVETDINILANSKQLSLSYGTFSLLVLLLNRKLEKVFVPDYVYLKWKNEWKFDIKEYLKENQELIVVDLPGYFKNEQHDGSQKSMETIVNYKPN